MSDTIPRTEEEFRLWMFQKVGEIHTSQAAMTGDLKVAVAEHASLTARVVSIESAARTAKYWENGKIIAVTLGHAIANAFHIHI